MLPQYQDIKYTSVAFTTNKTIQVCVEKVDGFKRSDAVGKSICSGYADNMVLNKTLDVFPAINSGGWNLQAENCILTYLVFLSIVYMQECLVPHLACAVTWPLPAPMAQGHHGPLNTATCPI